MGETGIRLYRGPTADAGGLIGAGEALPVETAVQTAVGTVYRRVVYLRIPSDGIATGIILEQPSLAGRFSATTVAVARHSPLLLEPWRLQDDRILVRLKRPWHVRQATTHAPAGLDFFRMDGDTIAERATVSAFDSDLVEPEFISRDFAIALSPDPRPRRKGLAKPVAESRQPLHPPMPGGPAAAAAPGKAGDRRGKAAVMDRGFYGLKSLTLNSYPTTPRISVPADLATPLSALTSTLSDVAMDLLWQQAGESRETVECALASALESVLLPKISAAFRQAPGNGGDLWVPIAIDSDTPCVWTPTDIDLPVRFLVDRFQDLGTKFVMDFQDNGGSPRAVPLRLPPGDITHASLRVDTGNKDSLKPFTGAADETANKGLMMDRDHWYACRITPPEAAFYGAAAVRVTLLSPELKLEASLIEGDLTPSGRPLVTAAVSSSGQASGKWLTLKFDPVRLDQAAYWLTLRASEGQGVWLCASGEGAAVTQGHLQSPSQPLRAFEGLLPVCRLMAVDPAVRRNTPLFELLVDGTPISLNPGQDRSYELELPQGRAGGGLSVRQMSRGLVIFSEPKIEYRPPPPMER